MTDIVGTPRSGVESGSIPSLRSSGASDVGRLKRPAQRVALCKSFSSAPSSSCTSPCCTPGPTGTGAEHAEESVKPGEVPEDGVEIAWRTVTGRRGRATLTGESLRFLGDEDATRMLNFLGLEEEEAVNNVSDEPEFLFIEICLDSGAGDHVLSRVDIPGFVVEESPGSKAGRNFVAAGGKRIRNEGQARSHFLGDRGAGLTSVSARGSILFSPTPIQVRLTR